MVTRKYLERITDEINSKRDYIKECTAKINELVDRAEVGEIDEEFILNYTQKIQVYALKICELQTKLYYLEEYSYIEEEEE